VIEIDDLHFSYPGNNGERSVLRGIGLTLIEGEAVALLGANGSGKTTLVRCLNGLLQPTKGDVRVDGLSVRHPPNLREIRTRVGMVFQNPDDQIVSAQVNREVAFGLENLGVPTPEMHCRVDGILSRFGLDRYRRHSPHLLSGGERQRLSIASVVATEPRYLLLDEPTALLDPASRSAFLELLDTLRDPGGITPLLITQFPEDAARMDRVIVLEAGAVAMDGPPTRVFSEVSALQRMGLEAPVASRIAFAMGSSPPLPLTPDELVASLPDSFPPELPSSPGCAQPAAASGPPIVSAQKLRHVYNQGLATETVALGGLDLQVSRGTSLALVGPSGSGKSTFAQHLNGLLQPSAGEVTVCGFPMPGTVDLRELRRRVGYIFQFPEAQLFADTVAEDVAFGPVNLDMDDIPRRVEKALLDVGLAPDAYRHRSPLALSGGEKRRVAIAGVLAMQPEVLVLDEPTAGLDPAGAREIRGLFGAMRDAGSTLVLISHDMDLVAHLGQRVVALDAGHLALDTTPEGAFRAPGRLRSLHLELSEAAEVALRLREHGLPIPASVTTESALLSLFGAA